MELHKLVELRRSVEIDSAPAVSEIDLILAKCHRLDGVDNPDIVNALLDASAYYQRIKNRLLAGSSLVNELLNKIDQEIDSAAAQLIPRGHEYITRSQPEPISAELMEIIVGRINQYVDWRFPGLEIQPGRNNWTQYLVACDPLYLVSTDSKELAQVRSQFAANYQNRIRCYDIDPTTNSLTQLPAGQFGFVLMWSVLEYQSVNEIAHYLRQLYSLLRTGGTLMFSYNNCQLPLAAQRAAEGKMTWATMPLLAGIAQKLGFEIVHHQDFADTISWAELRKPGQLATVRAHQVMGEIKSHTS